MIIRAIDFETTGIPSVDDPHAIVEIGWCDLPATEWKDTLVNPERKIPPEAMAVHHITDDMVRGWIKKDDALSFVSGADIYVAHNASYEAKFYDPGKPWICTYKVALRVWPEMKSHSLQYLRYALELPVAKDITMPHRAGPDAYVCALLFERIQAQPNAPDMEAMIRWSSGPALLPRITFGKHRGSKWEDAPTDYLEWIVAKSDMDGDIKANARHHLKVRKG